jgi:hypothetical protein
MLVMDIDDIDDEAGASDALETTGALELVEDPAVSTRLLFIAVPLEFISADVDELDEGLGEGEETGAWTAE